MIIVTYIIIKANCCRNLTTFRINLQRRNAIRHRPIVQFNKSESSPEATCKILINKYEPTVTLTAPRQGLDF